MRPVRLLFPCLKLQLRLQINIESTFEYRKWFLIKKTHASPCPAPTHTHTGTTSPELRRESVSPMLQEAPCPGGGTWAGMPCFALPVEVQFLESGFFHPLGSVMTARLQSFQTGNSWIPSISVYFHLNGEKPGKHITLALSHCMGAKNMMPYCSIL